MCIRDSAGGQTFSVLLNNPEEVDFHFVVDPPELAGFDPAASIFPSVVFDYLADTPTADWSGFQSLPAGSTRRLEGLREGAHLIVGFFLFRGRAELPVKALTIKAGGGMSERIYSVYVEPSLFKARSDRGRLALLAPRPKTEPGKASSFLPPVKWKLEFQVDNRYQEWEAVPAIAAFTACQPVDFSLEKYGSAPRLLPLRQSRYWQKAGTSLAEFKAVREDRALHLFLSTQSVIREGLSIFLYFYDPKDPPDSNRVTVELIPASGAREGLVALWVKGAEPVGAGALASGSFFIEASIDSAQLQQALASRLELASLQVSTCYHDRDALSYEEFFYPTLGLKDIPAVGDLQFRY